MMAFNPEFQRNVWLKLSPSRFAAMPVILGAVFYINYLVSGNTTAFLNSLRLTAFIALGLLLFLLGVKEVSDSISSEVNNKTWDSQRMTSIGPWEMALGKLFGSTIYTWYGSTFCIAAIIISSFYLPQKAANYKLLVNMLMAALMIHAASLSFILTGLRKNRHRQTIKSSSHIVLAFILLLLGYIIIPQFLHAMRLPQRGVIWYDYHFSLINFTFFSIFIFLCWSLIGLYRNMRLELQFYNGPWVWLLFLATLMFYCAGFVDKRILIVPQDRFAACLYLSYAIAIVLTYLMAFGESKNSVDFRLLLEKFKSRHWKEFQYNLPLWLVTMAVAVLLSIMTFIASLLIGKLNLIENEINYLFPLTVLLFLLRDMALLIFLNLKDNANRADMMAFIYLLILYVPAPIILSLSDLDVIIAVFLPVFSGTFLAVTLPVLLQCLILFYLVNKRWKTANLLG
jgi:hypothetical protein